MPVWCHLIPVFYTVALRGRPEATWTTWSEFSGTKSGSIEATAGTGGTLIFPAKKRLLGWIVSLTRESAVLRVLSWKKFLNVLQKINKDVSNLWIYVWFSKIPWFPEKFSHGYYSLNEVFLICSDLFISPTLFQRLGLSCSNVLWFG